MTLPAIRPDSTEQFISWFRSAAPYVNAFRGRTFVIACGGEIMETGQFHGLANDLNLLTALGIRLIFVHGARPQINAQLKLHKQKPRYFQGLRVTDERSMVCVKLAVGMLRIEIESLLSLGLPNTPMAGADIRVVGGNFITAQPVGVIEGVDYQFTGRTRKVDTVAIRRQLDAGDMVLLSPVGYSPTGEAFNLGMEDIATRTAIALKADKLIFFNESSGVRSNGKLIEEMTVDQAEKYAAKTKDPELQRYLPCAIGACRHGVEKVHLISRSEDGALLTELFTHAGSGTMITQGILDVVRPATIEDVGGILQLIEPLEANGTLVRRGRELIEQEIGQFFLMEHDGITVGCAALYTFPKEKVAEFSCFAVSAEHRGQKYGERLLAAIEERARKLKIKQLFVLTTRTAHWFLEQGFVEKPITALPKQKQAFYNLQRKSKVFFKTL